MLEITITVDTNDGDCACAVNSISKEDLDRLKPLIAAINEFKPYKIRDWFHHQNWPSGDCCREDLGEKEPGQIYDFPEEIIELFENFLPSSEHGFHTIERIEVCPQRKKIRLL